MTSFKDAIENAAYNKALKQLEKDMKDKSIYQNNIDIQKAEERKQLMKEVLDKLWSGAKVNNKLDGYWYVRLSDVADALGLETPEKEEVKEVEETLEERIERHKNEDADAWDNCLWG